MLKRFLKKIFECSHKNALLVGNEGFCPTCGKYLKKTYFLVRCSNCGIKRVSKNKFGEIVPFEKYCTSCGCSEFVVEKYEKLHFADINYAIEIKQEVENSIINEVEIWIDENKNANSNKKSPRLLSEVKYIKNPYQR